MMIDDKIALVLSYIRENFLISDLLKHFNQLNSPVDRGSYVMISCPFHPETSPSFGFDDKKGIFHCFSCNLGGSYVKLFMLLHKTFNYLNLNFYQAINHILSENPNMSLALGFKSVSHDQVEQITTDFVAKRQFPRSVTKSMSVYRLYKAMTDFGMSDFQNIALAQSLMFSLNKTNSAILELLKSIEFAEVSDSPSAMDILKEDS